MAHPIFKIEAVFAGKGDALLVHCGTINRPRWVLVDGGHNTIYERFLRPRFEQLRVQHPKSLTKQGRIPLELVMLSHADEDHIRGLIDLKNDTIGSDTSQNSAPVDIRAMWLNGFDDWLFVDTEPAVVERVISTAAGSDDRTLSAVAARDTDMLAAIASTRQCRELRNFATGPAQIPLNEEFDGNLVQRGDPDFESKRISPVVGLQITVLGPDKQRIEKLKTRWRSDVKKLLADEVGEITAFDDQSPHNLASIMVMVERQKRRVLLTGDGRGDHLVEGLVAQGYLQDAKDHMHIDLFKLPHHGSCRNVAAETFRAVTADHYLISANGEHGNPDIATLDMLVEGRRKSKVKGTYRVHFTVPERAFERIPDAPASATRTRQRAALEALNHWLTTQRPPDFEPVFRVPDQLGTVVDLL